ncbi:MAG TPA: hypothetical protein VKE70_29590 [Candidatus Solibacter sp.]|nr:hypothetical protein [Candidatus Solibacter sp.]
MTFGIRLTMMCMAAFAGLQGLHAAGLEVFGGYSVTRMKPENGANSATMNGWNSSVTAYPWSRLGFTADFAGFYGAATGDYTAADGSTIHANNLDIRQYSFMGGPQVRLFHTQRIETSVRALFGGAHGYVPGTNGNLADQTSFAALFGSNFDVKVSKRVSMRFSPGMYLTQYGSNQTQKNLRFSVGPVFHFGGEN